MDSALGLFVAAIGIILALVLAWRSDWWQRKFDRKLSDQGKRVRRVEIISEKIQEKILKDERKKIQGDQSNRRQLPKEEEINALLNKLPPLLPPSIPSQLPIQTFARPLLAEEFLIRGIIIPPWPFWVWVDLYNPHQYFLISELSGEVLYGFRL